MHEPSGTEVGFVFDVAGSDGLLDGLLARKEPGHGVIRVAREKFLMFPRFESCRNYDGCDGLLRGSNFKEGFGLSNLCFGVLLCRTQIKEDSGDSFQSRLDGGLFVQASLVEDAAEFLESFGSAAALVSDQCVDDFVVFEKLSCSGSSLPSSREGDQVRRSHNGPRFWRRSMKKI